jgi:8-oxo-dGTP pyrophosphatase MutT (NUDIX family)
LEGSAERLFEKHKFMKVKKSLKHRKVAVIILFDKKKRILLQHRDKFAKRYPLFWGTFGGEIEKGETPIRAVRREALEELGYELKNPRLVLTHDFLESDSFVKRYVFMEKYDLRKKLTLGEGQGMTWHFFSDLNKLKIAEHNREIFEIISKNTY